MSETIILVLLVALPALVGAQLSSRARRVCFVGGLLMASLLVLVAPSGGAGTLVYRLGAIFFIGVALGAGIREGFSILSRRKRGSVHG